jgi:hypothetical protein
MKFLNRNTGWLKIRSQKKKPPTWINYEDARKILPYSQQWYQSRYMGYIDDRNVFHPPVLEEGKDWRRRHGVIEYRLRSLQKLQGTLATGSNGAFPPILTII